jgi:hypothetical protein
VLPSGPFIGTGSDDDVIYTQLGEQWTTIANSLPAIDGWKLEAEIVGYAAIGQSRLEYLEIDEPEGLRAFDAHVAAPGTEAFRYRQKLARARQQLVRTRSEELVRTVDELLVPVPMDIDQELPEEQAVPILREIKQAVDELERLLGEALEGGPRQGDLHRHLHFAGATRPARHCRDGLAGVPAAPGAGSVCRRGSGPGRGRGPGRPRKRSLQPGSVKDPFGSG